jgi:D-alanyl-lipoteichoic acid acyltransferase DltB (MBOAT superfamily)
MTLTSWIGDYLFAPLRMALRNLGHAGLVAAIFVNMLAVALWHGCSRTILLFGLMNGVYMAVSALTLKRRKKLYKNVRWLQRVRTVVGAIVTFHLVAIALAVFRSATVDDALYILSHMVPSRAPDWGLKDIGVNVFGLPGLTALVLMEVVHVTRANGTLRRALDWSPGWLRWSAYYAGACAVLVYGQTAIQTFIYARF